MNSQTMSQSNPGVAKTILNQIRTLDPSALMAYGYRACFYEDNSITFKVNGSKCKRAYVKISLNFMDTYDIEVFSFRKSGFDMVKKELGKSEGIYCDQLVEVLDRHIEGKGY
jgi:hypothetical protein